MRTWTSVRRRRTSAGLVVVLSVAILSDAMRAEIAPPVANQEAIPLDESDAIKSILGVIEQTLNEKYATGTRTAWRDAHAKAHGCVKADFSVKADIPAELRSLRHNAYL